MGYYYCFVGYCMKCGTLGYVILGFWNVGCLDIGILIFGCTKSNIGKLEYWNIVDGCG